MSTDVRSFEWESLISGKKLVAPDFWVSNMVTDGVGNPKTWKVLNQARTAKFYPMTPADGSSNTNAAQVHLIIQSSTRAMTNTPIHDSPSPTPYVL